jgi:hypothetical protein
LHLVGCNLELPYLFGLGDVSGTLCEDRAFVSTSQP